MRRRSFFSFLLDTNLSPSSNNRPQSTYSESRIEFDTKHRPQGSVIDVAESEYRSRVQPNYRSVVGTTVDPPSHRPHFKTSSTHVDEFTVDVPTSRPVYKESVHVTGTTVDAPVARSSFHEKVDIVEETVDAPRYAQAPKSKMGYYDEDGKHYPLLVFSNPCAPHVGHTQVCSRRRQATTTLSVRDCTSWLTVLRTLKATTASRLLRSVSPAALMVRRRRAPMPPTR